MRSVIPDYLDGALADVEADASGETAGYIPELAAADPERLGAVFATVDGEVYGAGDVDVEFTIQSISKPFTYALALSDRGFEPIATWDDANQAAIERQVPSRAITSATQANVARWRRRGGRGANQT